jgi:Flp pilus assembly protein TadD
MLLLKQSRGIEAIERFSRALEVKPDYADALTEQAFSQMDAGKQAQAAARFHDELRSRPGDALAHLNWGMVLLEQGRADEAEKEFSEAVRLHPRDARSQCQLAVALIRQRKAAEAAVHYRAAVRLRPLYTGALNGLAWILATSPDSRLRDGPEALRLARQACDATGHGQPGLLITLAAACAETGQFDNARDVISQAQALASKSGARDIEARAGQLLSLFNSRRTVAQALE